MTSRTNTTPLSAAETRWILERLSGGVIVINDAFDVCYRNAAARRLLHPHALRLHAPLPDIGSDPPLQALAEPLFQRGVLGEQELRTPSGRTYVVDGIVHAETHIGVIQIDDVSARARRNRAEQDFVVNAAHEFLSPLTAVAGAAQVLHDGAKDLPDVRDRFISHILDGANRLMSISRALLVLARAEAGIEPPRVTIVPIRPLLEAVAGDARDRSAEVTIQCAANDAALADIDLLRQALSNLLANARRHSRGTIEIQVTTENGSTVIEIADDGAGMLPQHLERATDRFFSGERDVDRFGIGLSIAAGAARVMGGALTLSSDAGGTRARVELPAARLVAP